MRSGPSIKTATRAVQAGVGAQCPGNLSCKSPMLILERFGAGWFLAGLNLNHRDAAFAANGESDSIDIWKIDPAIFASTHHA